MTVTLEQPRRAALGSTAARLAAAAVLWLLLLTVLRDGRFPWLIRGGLLLLTAMSAWRPAAGLIALAVITPFSDIIVTVVGSPPVRGTEAVVVAFLGGSLVALAEAQTASGRRLYAPALLVAAVVCSSVASVAWQLYRVGPAALQSALDPIRKAYFSNGDAVGVGIGAQLLEGLAVTLVVTRLIGSGRVRRGSIARALAIAAAFAAGLTLLLPFGVGPSAIVARHASRVIHRFAVHTGDLNAAGSYFALALGVATGLAVAASGRERQIWWAVAGLVLIGLMLSGSRSAWFAVLVVAAATIVLMSRHGGHAGRAEVPAAAIALIAVAVTIAAFARVPLFTFLGDGFQMRRDFSEASVRLIAARPVLGVGIGRYYPLSHLVFSHSLAQVYGYENAHDYFLQIAAELGLIGLGAFVWFNASALSALRGIAGQSPRDAGLVGGVIAFLITCISGHPLLVPEVAITFWIALGVAASLDDRREQTTRASPWREWVTVCCCAALLVSVPWRPGTPRVRLPASQDGFGPWLVDGGRRLHTLVQSGAMFVQPNVSFVEIPVRLNSGRAGRPVTLFIRQPRWSEHRIVVNDGWQLVPVTLPQPDPLTPYQRIDLQVIDYADPHGDTHGVGVDVGEIAILDSR